MDVARRACLTRRTETTAMTRRGSGLTRPEGAASLPRNKDLPKWHSAVPPLKLAARYPPPNTQIKQPRRSPEAAARKLDPGTQPTAWRSALEKAGRSSGLRLVIRF
jgi:hypothetical protein